MKKRDSDNRHAAQELRTVALFGYREPLKQHGALVRKRALDANEKLRFARESRDPLFTQPLEKAKCRS